MFLYVCNICLYFSRNENRLLLRRIQVLESQVNNVTPVQSLSSPAGWEKVHREEIQVGIYLR